LPLDCGNYFARLLPTRQIRRRSAMRAFFYESVFPSAGFGKQRDISRVGSMRAAGEAGSFYHNLPTCLLLSQFFDVNPDFFDFICISRRQ